MPTLTTLPGSAAPRSICRRPPPARARSAAASRCPESASPPCSPLVSPGPSPCAVRPVEGLPLSAKASAAASALLVVYAFVLAGGLGLSSAHWMTAATIPSAGCGVGAWTVWPRSGSREADPYTRAVNARTGAIPLGVGEGLAAARDAMTAGRALDARCAYRVGPTTPQARFWTLTLYDVAGRPRRHAARAQRLQLGRAPARPGRRVRHHRLARGSDRQLADDAGERPVSLMLPPLRQPGLGRLGRARFPRVLPRVERLECAP